MDLPDGDTEPEPPIQDIDMEDETEVHDDADASYFDHDGWRPFYSPYTVPPGTPLFDEITPDSDVASTADLINLVSQFRSTNLQAKSHLSPPPLLSTATDEIERSSPISLASRLDQRRQKSRNRSHVDRRTDQYPLARIQSRLEQIANLEKAAEQLSQEYQGSVQSIAEPSIRAHPFGSANPDLSESDSAANLRSISAHRRIATLQPKAGYVKKSIRLRKDQPIRNPRPKSPP